MDKDLARGWPMTRGFNNNRKFSFLISTIMVASLVLPLDGVASPNGQLSGLSGNLEKFKVPECNQESYKFPNGTYDLNTKNACDSCGGAIKSAQEETTNAYNSAMAVDTAAKQKAIAGASAAAAGNKFQQNSQTSTANGTKSGRDGAATRSTNASAFAKKAEQVCKQKIKDGCDSVKLQGQDQSDKDESLSACESLQSQAEQVAKDQGSAAGDLGQLMQQAGQLAQQLGQMMQQQPEQKNPKDPSQSSISDTQSTSLSSKNPGASVGFDTSGANGAKVGAAGSAKGGAYASPARDFSAEASNLNAGGLGSGISSNKFGANTGGEGATSASSGGMNSSGASLMGEAPEKAAAVNAKNDATAGLEWGGGGGGGGGYKQPMFGLKGKNDSGGDLADLTGGENNLSGEEGDRTLASADEMSATAQDINDDGDSLFNVIHSKLSEVKRRGSI